jgi:DNA-binding CsgD family transcriptional regulator
VTTTGGHQPSTLVEKVIKLKTAGRSPTEIAEELSISRMSVYRALRG